MEIIKLNLIPSGVNSICHCSQYDNGRVIRLELFDGLTPYTLQSGDTVTLNVRKPDNTIITASVTATQGNNYVDIVTTEQMCAVVGNNLCDLTITNGSVVIGTLNFYMQIERDVLADGIPSQSVIEDLDALVQEAIDSQISDINDILTQFTFVKNLADFSTVVYGKYYGNYNGNVTGIDTTNTTGIIAPIKLLKDHEYYINYNTKSATFILFGELDGSYIGNLNTYLSGNKIITDKDCYLYISVSNAAAAAKIQVTEGLNVLAPHTYNELITTLFDNKPIGDFIDTIDFDNYLFYTTLNTFFSWLSGVTRESWHKVVLKLGSNTYNVTSEITLPDNIEIVGNNSQDTIINYTPTDTSSAAIEQNSLFRLEQNAIFKNLKMQAINARYVIHAESANHYKDWKVIVENCVIYHKKNTLGSWSSQHAWGEGASSGCVLLVKNTQFITEDTVAQTAAFSLHNNTNFDNPLYHEFIDCEFISAAGCAFRAEGQASGQKDKCILIGCSLYGNIYSMNAQTIEIDCTGCNLMPTNASTYFISNSVAKYTEYTIKKLNNTGSTIPKGSIVAFNNFNSVKLANSGDLIAGFTINDTADGDECLIITKGYYRLPDGAPFGTRYTVNNGVLAISASGTVGISNGGGFVLIDADFN